MKTYVNMISRVNRWFTMSAGILVLAMVIILIQDVLRRYLLNDPTSWALDVSRFLLVYIFFLGLGPALETGHHVSTDLISSRFNEATSKVMVKVVYVLTVLFGIIMLWQLVGSTIEVFKDGRLFPTVVQIPMKYVYMITPIGTLQFILTAIAGLIQSLSTFEKENADEEKAAEVQA
ncbi:MAG TPA: TRAP transporter small permease [Brevibacillus sp.]|nr:TRAP transporter small permease [Brevibacillus sp.]